MDDSFVKDFYARYGFPPPTLSPDERMRRRTAFRNERHLYKRTCDGTGKNIISCFAPEAPFPVYDQSYWWSDEWDAHAYGQDFDFNRPFFDQFAEMAQKVPRLGVAVTKSENCEYNMYCVDSKNCYLCQRVQAEDCLYCYLPIYSRDCMDCYNINDCELCYEVIDGENNYNVRFSQHVFHCRDSSFLFDCRSCQDCFFCAGLRNAQYYFCNEKCTKEVYEQKIAEFQTLSHEQKTKLWDDFVRLKAQLEVPAFWGTSTENVSGNYLFNAKNVHESFDVKEAEDIAYAWGHIYGKDSMDTCFYYHNDHCYEGCSSIHSSYLFFCYACYSDCHHLSYCMSCMNNTHDCFGCMGLKKSEYCLLNKAYTKQEYETLQAKVIAHMKETKEYGEFFPITLSDFSYNETVAQEYFPLTKEEALAQGYKWKEEAGTSPRSQRGDTGGIEIGREATPDTILSHTFHCAETHQPFKIQKAELAFYQKMGLPLPRLHPDTRYHHRVALRNPRTLFDRTCQKCDAPIRTSYAPNRSEKILCEKCYEQNLES